MGAMPGLLCFEGVQARGFHKHLKYWVLTTNTNEGYSPSREPVDFLKRWLYACVLHVRLPQNDYLSVRKAN